MRRTVRVDAAQKILFQTKVIEGRDNRHRLGGLEDEFLLRYDQRLRFFIGIKRSVALTSSPALMPDIVEVEERGGRGEEEDRSWKYC